MKGLVSADTSLFCFLACCSFRRQLESQIQRLAVGVEKFCGRVGEWLKPADCKSAAPCGLRRFESFPVHQDSSFVKQSPGKIFSRDALTSNQQVHRRKSQTRCSKAVANAASMPDERSAPQDRIQPG